MDKLNALKMFCSVAQHQSFAGAARIAGTSPSTISKAIERLENDVGFRLFQRTTRSISLTSQGKQYLEATKTLLDAFTQSEIRIKSDNDTAAGSLKINAPVAYGRRYIGPIISQFCKTYPNITIDLTLNDAYVDMIDQGYDISIRSGTLQDSRLIAQQLSSMDMVTFTSPTLAHTLNGLFNEPTIKSVPWVLFRYRQTGRVQTVENGHGQYLASSELQVSAVIDDGETIVDWCAADMGFGQLPHFLVKHALEENRIIPVQKSTVVANAGIYVIYPKRNFQPLRVKLFIDFIKNYLAENDETPLGTWATKLTPFQSINPDPSKN